MPTADLALTLVETAARKGLTIATAESCTGGMIGTSITDISGASAVFDRGFITYSNEAKCELLGVPASLIDAQGAVSEPVALAMVKGAFSHSHADLAVAVTGIAGPGGGTPSKPVGLVFIAAAQRFGVPRCEEHHFPGSRENVREAATEKALQMLYELAKSY